MRDLGLLAMAAIAGSAWSAASLAAPPQIPRAAVDAEFATTLERWSPSGPVAAGFKDRIAPDDPAYGGAELWRFTTPERDLAAATLAAFTQAGMTAPKIAAAAPLNPEAVRFIGSSPDADGGAFFVRGRIGEAKANGIALVVYGRSDGELDQSGVQAFMAPETVFAALGGYAVVGVRWLSGHVSSDEETLADGSLAPEDAVQRLSVFFSLWVEAHVIPMLGMSMQIQQQSIQNMQSWNNAMNLCAGEPNCTIQPDTDGNWRAQIE